MEGKEEEEERGDWGKGKCGLQMWTGKMHRLLTEGYRGKGRGGRKGD